MDKSFGVTALMLCAALVLPRAQVLAGLPVPLPIAHLDIKTNGVVNAILVQPGVQIDCAITAPS